MTGKEFFQGWWQDVPKLLKEADILFSRIEEKTSLDKYTLAKERIYEQRKWSPAKVYIEKNFLPILRELNYFYFPKTCLPGPCFIFPQRDLNGNYCRAQTKPLYPIIDENSNTSSKYRVCGVKMADFLGPVWLGNSDQMIQNIIEKRFVVLVEGAFDLLACRLLAPKLPLLSPLTKRIGAKHEVYLQLLGVEKIYLMFDNEKSEAGNMAMRQLQNTINWAKVEMLFCPASDPSAALENLISAKKLRDQLNLLTS